MSNENDPVALHPALAAALARIEALEAELNARLSRVESEPSQPPTDPVLVEPPPTPPSPYWYSTCLALPSWMTDSSETESARVTMLRRNGLDVVMMPGGAEEIVLVTPSGSHMQELVWQDLLSLRKWKERGGPRWAKGLGVNLHRGEIMQVKPLSAVGTDLEFDQPWGTGK